MALPEFTKKMVEVKLARYCAEKIPDHARHQIRIAFKIRGNSVTLFEERPYYQDNSIWTSMPIANFRFDPNTTKWTLYCADRNSKWFLYMDIDSKENFDDLLSEVDRDPTGIFWG
jgi:hypothetical protein